MELDEPTLRRVSSIFKLVANPARLQILALLSRGEATVGDMSRAIDQHLSSTSSQLRRLRKAGAVECRKDGPFVRCKLTAKGRAMMRAVRIVADSE